jgi:hypothetical protein
MDTNLDPDADCFKPPPGSILVECIHCGEDYDEFDDDDDSLDLKRNSSDNLPPLDDDIPF